MDKIYVAGPKITETEINIVQDALINGWYEEPHKYIELFQNEFASYHNRKFGIMTSNCTNSIHLILSALGIGKGDEVIVPECTWIATISSAISLGATPIFCDIEPVNWCLCPKSLKKNITNKTKAIIPVDLFGNMPLMDEIFEVADGIPIIEDAAESLGSIYKETKAGKFGVGSVFSFHRTKTITTGEGGMLLLDDEDLYKKCIMWRDHGRSGALPEYLIDSNEKMYMNQFSAYKYTPSNIQAALGYSQFKRIEELLSIKRYHLEFYKNRLKEIPGLSLNPEPENGINGAWITTVVWDNRYKIKKEEFVSKLIDVGIPARPFFYPLSSLPPFTIKNNKNSYDISNRGLNLPGAYIMTDDQLDYICDKFIQICSSNN